VTKFTVQPEHHAFLQRLSRKLVSDWYEAEDVVQETLVTALENPPRDLQKAKSWLATVMRNKAKGE